MDAARQITEPDSIPVDAGRAEAFAGRMVDILNGASLALMTSIGHRTGLFDTMAVMAPAGSAAIAARAGLDERYVREWLGAMVTGAVVEHDPVAGTYRLPAAHAACLTRAATPDNIAAFTQYVGILGGVEDAVVDCFRTGGGVPYSAYHRFHEVMAEDSGQTVLPALVDRILPLVPGLVARLEAGIEVLDVGCGRGRAMNLLARAFPRSRFLGYDLSEEAICAARAEARAQGSRNVLFLQRDLTDFDEPAQFDLVTAFDAIHDQARPDAVLAGIHRALRPGGTFLMQDIAASSHLHHNLDHPIGPFLYTISTMHCMTVSLAQGGAGLGTAWGRELAQQMLAEAGFTAVRIHNLAYDIQNDYYVAAKD
ncbi:MAG: class I SAM-dependent methyltransferase [Hyphomicrobiales bacterium]|nr:class I SAM-dependent methyltransferase [Hyphomicrobiales bacterium]MCP5370738.1 class I SAM-dependent methyltransferase [Hyphomicrobiales bacterium]